MARLQFQFVLVFVLIITISIGAINKFNLALAQPTIAKDPNLKVELVTQGLRSPTSMAFLGPNDMLVLEKESGTVQRIVNGKMLPQPLLQVPVSITDERGMLGIAIAKHSNGPTYVFLYYTKDGGGGPQSLANVLYRYELVNDQLTNPKLLLNLPALRGPNHDGGKVVIGPDNNVYTVIGDLRSHRTQAQNVINGPPADSTGGVLRVTQDGQPVSNAPLGQGTTSPLNLYYAYGIRNSFGMDFDPITKKLWDTENGPGFGDEVNLVEAGFNSGWNKVQGLWKPNSSNPYFAGSIELHPPGLVDFGGRGKYRAPEITWYNTVAPTALKFINSDKLGKQYTNDMFVGDFDNGNLYDFHLNKSRTGLLLDVFFARKIVNNTGNLKKIPFGHGLGEIPNIKVGPDGYLYVLSLYQGGGNCLPPVYKTNCITYSSRVAGTIFRIIPVETK